MKNGWKKTLVIFIWAAMVLPIWATNSIPFTQWSAAAFNETDSNISGPTAIPRKDGIPNLLKYLCDIDPTRTMTPADLAALPAVGTMMIGNTPYLTLTYRQSAQMTGLVVSVQTSADLQSWQTITPDVSQNLTPDPDTGDPILMVGIDMTGKTKEFIRLNVALPNAPPTMVNSTLLAATAGTPYTYAFLAGGYPASTFSKTGTLPPGLTLSSAGVLSGTPTTAGTYSCTLMASNGVSPNAAQLVTIVVLPAPGTVVAAIDCGSTSSYTGTTSTSFASTPGMDGPGTVYSADTHFTGGSAVSTNQALLGLGYTGYDPKLYQKYRSGVCTYTIPNLLNGTYVVQLQYCETVSSNVVGSRMFNVAIQGNTVLSNFDILTKVPLFTPIYETFNATVSNGTLTIAQTSGSASVPVISAITVRALPTPPTKIVPGEYFNYDLVNGRLYANGSNRTGEAGLYVYQVPFPGRPPVTPPGLQFADAACGGYQTVALDTLGNVWVWGINSFGEQGMGTTDTTYYLPQQILTDINGNPFNNVKAIESGFHFEVALKYDGTVWVWGLSGNDGAGLDSGGIVGNGDPTGQNVLRPSKVIFPNGVSIAKISASNSLILALDTTGMVWSWGAGSGGGINRGTNNTDPSTPAKLVFPRGTGTITTLVAGDGTCYVIDSNKNLYGWGINGTYLGLGGPGNTWQPTPTPIAINFLTTGNFSGHVADVKVSSMSTHVLRDDGTLWSWGSGSRGEIGDGTMADWLATTPTYSFDYNLYENLVMEPVQVMSNVANIYARSVSGSVFAVKSDGSIWSWGFNKSATLGNGVVGNGIDVATHPDTFDSPYPAQVQPY